MKRLFYIFILIIVLLCGCSPIDDNSKEAVTVNLPSDDSVNGYRLPIDTSGAENTSSATSATLIYCASTGGTKFHLSSCGSAKIINPDNLFTSSSRQDFVDKGYEPCQRCKP